jgi:hypothetical protein
VAGVELAADKPLPERWVGSVEGFAPGLVPIEKVGVVVEAFRKIFFAEFFYESGIGKNRLGDELFGRPKEMLLFLVDSNLRFREFVL